MKYMFICVYTKYYRQIFKTYENYFVFENLGFNFNFSVKLFSKIHNIRNY